MTKHYNWKDKINEEELDEVTQILRNNGIIIFPTETVYGIGGNALSNDVVEKIYNVKKRPREKAINIMLAEKSEITKYANITSELEKKIIEKLMPGPITIILNKKNNFGKNFTLENNTIGIRIPDCKIIQAILQRLDFPIIAPSANISGTPSCTYVEELINDFENKVDAIIDGGKAKTGLSSTIVQVIDNEIKILREGSITKEHIDRIIKI